jgi:hypothetical protein
VADDLRGRSIINWAVTAWRDAIAAFRQMPAVLGVAFLAVLAVDAVHALAIPFEPGPIGPGQAVLAFILSVIQGLLLTPAAIAVHRFVLLGERTAQYRLDPSDPRFRQFFFFTVVFQILLTLPTLVITEEVQASGVMSGLSWLIWVALFALAAMVMLRTLILFPAIAVDAPGAGWGNALHDSKGQAWRLLLIVIVVAIPMLLPYVPLAIWLTKSHGQSLVGMATLVTVNTVEIVAGMAAYAALASRIFLVLANRLGRPPGVPGSLSPA